MNKRKATVKSTLVVSCKNYTHGVVLELEQKTLIGIKWQTAQLLGNFEPNEFLHKFYAFYPYLIDSNVAYLRKIKGDGYPPKKNDRNKKPKRLLFLLKTNIEKYFRLQKFDLQKKFSSLPMAKTLLSTQIPQNNFPTLVTNLYRCLS